ncbi:MAG: ATP-binding protein [Terriglobales bacterium]
MRSLFLKIFLSYWLTLALCLVFAILFTLVMRPPRASAVIEAQQAKFLNEAALAYQAGGPEQARNYLRGLHESDHVWAFLYQDSQKEVSGRKPPEWIEHAAKGEGHTIDSFWGRMGPMQFARPSMVGSDGHRYSLVIALPPEHTIFGPHGTPWLGILVAILSSGLVCSVLARYLTTPIVRLRAATQKLASGDLTARAGVPHGRHDEIGELVRDFDRMAERLENLVNAQNRLLTDISHELRSPLARLNVALELARQRSGSEAVSALQRINRESNRLNELIGRLLTVARLESGEAAVPKDEVHLGELIREVVKDATFEAQTRRCRINCTIVNDCVLQGDAGLLQSAVENVVRNAMRYTTEGSDVEVRLECDHVSIGEAAVLTVSDSGPGVPEEALAKLFRPFYRIDDSRERGTGGAGLGLAITERAVRLHGGLVRALNRSEGGLRVEIWLPMVRVESASSTTSTTEEDQAVHKTS